jgi:hypothetical protein
VICNRRRCCADSRRNFSFSSQKLRKSPISSSNTEISVQSDLMQPSKAETIEIFKCPLNMIGRLLPIAARSSFECSAGQNRDLFESAPHHSETTVQSHALCALLVPSYSEARRQVVHVASIHRDAVSLNVSMKRSSKWYAIRSVRWTCVR